jgi:hypothetical protein
LPVTDFDCQQVLVLLMMNDERHGAFLMCSFAAMPPSALDLLSRREKRVYKRVNKPRNVL